MKAPQQRQRYIAAGGLTLLVALAAVIGSVDSTTSFRVCFGVLLFIICVGQLKVAADLYKHRNNLLLQLFQPYSAAPSMNDIDDMIIKGEKEFHNIMTVENQIGAGVASCGEYGVECTINEQDFATGRKQDPPDNGVL